MDREMNIFAKLHYKIKFMRGKCRIAYYKIRGMSIGPNTTIANIEVPWPAALKIGSDCEIRSQSIFWIKNPFKKENKITIGNNVFVGRNVEFNCSDFISIGDHCLIASSTILVDSSHTFFKNQLINQQPTKIKGIILEEDVWVGSDCKILYGVHLGRGCIVGAGAVVNKSIPANEIWGGVPARKIGERKEPFTN